MNNSVFIKLFSTKSHEIRLNDASTWFNARCFRLRHLQQIGSVGRAASLRRIRCSPSSHSSETTGDAWIDDWDHDWNAVLLRSCGRYGCLMYFERCLNSFWDMLTMMIIVDICQGKMCKPLDFLVSIQRFQRRRVRSCQHNSPGRVDAQRWRAAGSSSLSEKIPDASVVKYHHYHGICNHYYGIYNHYLVATGTWLLFFHILGIVIPIDFHIFQRGWNHQPVMIRGFWNYVKL